MYVIYLREPGLNWWWGWYLAKITNSEERGRKILDEINALVEVALLEWHPDFANPLPTTLYFRWPVNSRLLFKGRIRNLKSD
jgi:hypothetical protein